MKKKLNTNKLNNYLIFILGVFAVLVVAGSLYWFSFRPYKYRKECARDVYELVMENKANILVQESLYRTCLRGRAGIEN